MKVIPTNDFIKEFQNYPSYDNIRKIASCIDGLKNSSRKVIYYSLTKNIQKPTKTAQFKADVENKTQYLHGDITGVVESLAKNYCGSNNINLLEPHGNFGTRQVPSASASRYTFTKPSDKMYELFDREDLEILNRQYFEGDEIEPTYLMPLLPLILINGSEGISSGYAQKIFNRDPKRLMEAIINKLNNPNFIYNECPWYKSFDGVIEQGEETNKWVIKGKCIVDNTTQVTVTELPVGYSLQHYIKILDRLEDQGIIKSYQDLSENDFLFRIKFTREQLSKYKDNNALLSALKLISNVSENYTCQNENNIVIVFNSVDELLNYYIKIRLEFNKRKIEHKLNKISSKLELLNEKRRFILSVINDTIVIFKRTKEDIYNQLEKGKFSKIDDSYKHLLNMNISSFTEEQIKSLESEIKKMRDEKNYLLNSTEKTLYIDQLKRISL